MKNLIKIISVMFLVLFCAVNFVFASTTGGDLGNGLNTGIGGTVVVAPTANVPAGTYASVQNVSLAAIGSQSVHYTTDGSDPTCLNPNNYSSPIAISTTSTLKAIACYGNGVTSSISSFGYEINLPTPTPASPASSGGVAGGGGGGGGGTPPATAKMGDINNDSKVDKYDFALLMLNWGKTGTNTSDLNNDGKVDKYDFAVLMANWSM